MMRRTVGAAHRAGTTPRSAIVTASGTAIGRAVVERLTAGGTRVVAVDADERALAWSHDHERVVPLAADAGAVPGAERMTSLAAERHGPPRAVVLLVHGAAVGPLLGGSPTAIDDAISGPLRAAFVGTRAAHAAIRDAGGGAVTIVVLGAEAGGSCSGIVQAAVANLMRGFAVELGRYDVRVNVVVPAAPAPPARRSVAAEEVADVVAFLCSSAAAWIDGVVLPVDGGLGVGVGSGAVRHD